MRPFISDPDFTLYVGDVLETLRELQDDSIHCVVTSPPYWGLRDYGTGSWEGGDPDCDHARPTTTMNVGFNERWGQGAGQRKQEKKSGGQYAQECAKCGAVRTDRQIGLEPTPVAFVETMVDVFREVRRVLRPDGTCWLNLGDSYAGGGGGNYGSGKSVTTHQTHLTNAERPNYKVEGLKPKDLVGIPWRVALALQEDGWYLRADIIWSKPNPMPESVTDRPTKGHEYLFLLAKSPRYFYDHMAIREPATWDRWGDQTNGKYADESRGGLEKGRGAIIRPRRREELQAMQANGRNKRTVWEIATESFPEAHFATFPQALVEPCIKAGTSEHGCCPTCGAPWERTLERKFYGNLRTDDNKDGHRDAEVGITRNDFGGQTKWAEYEAPKTAGWQPACDCGGVDLRPILTPTGEDGGDDPTLETGRAGMDRPRAEDAGVRPITRYEQAEYAAQLKASPARPLMEEEVGKEAFAHYIRTDESGARPIPEERLREWIDRGLLKAVLIPESDASAPVPCTVLDPFMGSGTTALVARRLGRRSVGIELNPEYAELAARRLQQLSLL